MSLIKCPQCGKNISDKAAKCPNCGYVINRGNNSVHQNLIRCTDCGALINSNSATCPNCGGPINPPINSIQQQWNTVPQQVINPSVINTNNYYQNNEMAVEPNSEEKSAGYIILNIFAYLFYFAGLADFCLGIFAHVDLTGVWWSPLLLEGIGACLQTWAKKCN